MADSMRGVSKACWFMASQPEGDSSVWSRDHRVRASVLSGQSVSGKDGGKIDFDRVEEAAADARSAGITCMVNFLMQRLLA